MRVLFDMLAGLIALLAAAVLSQFGVNLQIGEQGREVHRVSHDCADPAATGAFSARSDRSC